MPRKPGKSTKQERIESYVPDFNLGDEENENPLANNENQPQIAQKGGKKRPSKSKESVYCKSDSDEDGDEEGPPVSSILHQFGAEMKKTISSKRRKLESFTKQCSSSREKVDVVLESQKKGRNHLYEEYKKQIGTLLGQWESDIERVKESEEKLNTIWNQQMKLLSQIRVVQSQRYKSMKQLHDQYSKSVAEIESSHDVQHKTVTDDLNKELVNLQKKFILDMRNQEMTNMRKSLQSMLYQ